MATRNIEASLDELRGRIDEIQGQLLSQARSAGKKIADEAPVAASQLRELAADAVAEGSDRVREIAAASRRLWNATGDGIGDARDTIRVAAGRTRNALVDAASTADRGSRQAVTSVRSFVTERPITSLMIAIGAGIVAGRLLDRD